MKDRALAGGRWRGITPRRVIEALGWLLAWGWAIVAGGGGLGLIITEGR